FNFPRAASQAAPEPGNLTRALAREISRLRENSLESATNDVNLPEKRSRRMEQKSYIIRGGEQGRARLRVLSRVMRPTTLSLLDRAGIRHGMECLEVGCGSGDLAVDLARMVGAGGRVVATDIDEIKLRLARQEAEQQQLTNLE